MNDRNQRTNPASTRWLLGTVAIVASMAAIYFASGESRSAAVADAQWSYENVTSASVDEILDSEYRFDALWTDFNGDGCYDPFIFGHANLASSRLWLNRCDGSDTFAIVGNDEVHYYIPEPEWPRGSGWLSLLDFNGDGKQDFWTRDADGRAARYVNGSAAGTHVPRFSGKQDACNDACVFGDINGDHQLDIIHPDRGIESMLDRAAIAPATGPEAGVIVFDVDADGWADVVQSELGGYWHNEHGQLQWRDAGLSGHATQFAVADFDNNGSMDLFTINNGEPSDRQAHLYKNDGNGHFTDVTAGSGLQQLPYNSYWTNYGNTVAADLNNDGLQDLIVAGASYSPSVTILRNLGGMHFAKTDVDLGSAGHGSTAHKGRAAVADYDNDGRLDIIKTQDETNVGIWRNTTPTANAQWMKVRVRGPGMNSDGIGTDIKWYRQGSSELLAHMTVRTGEQHPQTWLHTGLGANASVDMVVSYPSGGPSYRFDDLASNQEVIVYSNGCLIQHWQPGEGWPLTPPANCTQACNPDSSASQPVLARTGRRSRPTANAERGRQAAAAAGLAPAAPTQSGCVD